MDQNQKKLNTLFTALIGSATECTLNQTDEHYEVRLVVPDDLTGIMVGYHGETIDALQLIVSQIINQNNPVYKPVMLDINGYRDQRRQKLEEIADRAISQALSSTREIILPPLPPHERRVIHLYAQNHDQVTTYSEGEGKNRRIIIRPKTFTPNTDV